MRKPASLRHSDTAAQILDVAEKLIQTGGYSAFSYRDIADALQITTASIHYHFKSKADLGKAVIDRYSERVSAALAATAADQSMTSTEMLDFYCQPYLQFARTADRICLCGALAGELPALPMAMRARVEKFFVSHQDWLAAMLKRGVARGEFALTAPAPKLARMIFGALQGALLVKRVTHDMSQLLDVIAAVKAQLSAQPVRVIRG